MEKWEKLAAEKTIEDTVVSLRANGMDVIVVENGNEAKKKVLEMLPKDAEVMTMSSVTLEETGITEEITESDKFKAVKKTLMKMDRDTQGKEMNRIGAAPEWAIGSVHAVTQDGSVLIASNTGSQLPAYVYAANKVIWVVGAQKIVKNFEEGMKRLYEHTLKLESERMKKLYGMPSFVSKLLIVNREIVKGRITIILVKEKLGF